MRTHRSADLCSSQQGKSFEVGSYAYLQLSRVPYERLQWVSFRSPHHFIFIKGGDIEGENAEPCSSYGFLGQVVIQLISGASGYSRSIPYQVFDCATRFWMRQTGFMDIVMVLSSFL